MVLRLVVFRFEVVLLSLSILLLVAMWSLLPELMSMVMRLIMIVAQLASVLSLEIGRASCRERELLLLIEELTQIKLRMIFLKVPATSEAMLSIPVVVLIITL